MRELLQMAEADAPPAQHSVDDIVAAGRRRSRRALTQRVGGLALLGVTVATAGVLSLINLAVPGSHGADTPTQSATNASATPAQITPGASPPFTFTFDGYQSGDYRVLAPDEVTAAYQTAEVLRDGHDAKGKPTAWYVGSLTVYQPRTFDPARFRSGTALTVQGREAYQIRSQARSISEARGPRVVVSGSPTATVHALAWQWAPDSWAVLEGQAPSDKAPAMSAVEEVTVAERFTVTAGDPVRARVPFRTGYLPAGFALQSVQGQSMTGDNRGMVTFVYATPQPSSGRLTNTTDLNHRSTVTSVVISILWVDSPPPDAVKRKHRCNPGQHWCATTLPGGKFYVAVEDPAKTLSDAELLKVADHLGLATITDARTWHPAG